MLNYEALVGLLYNTSLLLGLAVLYDNLPPRQKTKRLLRQIITGLILGAIGTAVMLTPWQFAPGIVFDTRSILLSLTGLFFGTIPTAVAVLLTSMLRIYQSGAGTWTGVAVIMTSAGIGIAWRHYRKWWRPRSSWVELYILGVVVHIAMLLWMLTLPGRVGLDVLSHIGIPVLVIFPVGTVLLGQLLVRQFNRRETETAVQQNEERLRQIVENMPVMLDVLDEDNNIVIWNAECERVSGYKAEEMIGNPHAWELLYPDASQRQKMFAEIAERPLHFRNREWPLTGKDGTVKTISWSNISEEFPIPGWFSWAVGVDVTDLNQALEQTQSSEAQYRRILETAAEGIWMIDADNKTTFANQKLADIFGYTIDEMIGADLFSFMDKEGVRNAQANLERHRQEIHEQHDFRFLHKDGHDIWVRISTNPIQDNEGQYVGALAMLTDITEQIAQQKALAESEERYRLLVDKSPYAIAIHQDGKLVFVNPAAIELLNAKSEKDLLGKPIDGVIAPEGLDAARNRIGRMLAGETGLYPAEDAYIRLDGSVVPVEVTAAPFTYKGRPAIQTIALDISEQKAAEKKQAGIEARFQRALENIPDVIVIYDADLRIQYINEATRKITGRPVSDFIGKTEEELWMPEVYESYLPALKKAFATGEIHSLETGVEIADGDIRHLHITCVPIHDKNGQTQEVIGITRDLTERKQAELELKASEEKYRLLFNLAPDGLVVTREGRIVHVNEVLLNMLGLENAAEIIGTSTVEWVHPTFAALSQNRLDKLYEENAILPTAAYQLQRKDGAAVDIEARSASLNDNEGTLTLAVLRDVTERKQAEAERRESEERFRTAFEHSASGMCLTSLDGELLKVNQPLCAMLGYTKKELEGLHFNNITHPDDIQVGSEVIHRMMAGEIDSTKFEKRYLHKTGAPIWVHINSAPFKDTSGTVQYFITQIEDITVRKQAEEALKKSEAQFKALVEQSITGIYVFREDHFLYVNNRFCEVFGYTEEEVLSQLIPTDVIAQVDKSMASEQVRRRIKGEIDSVHYIARGIKKDGTLLWVEIHGTRMQLDGKPAVTGTVLDITERVEAELALVESEERYRTTLDAANIGIWDWNMKTDLWEATPTYFTMLGYDPETDGQNREVWGGRTHPDDFDFVINKMETVRDKGEKGFNIEFRFRHKDGQYHWINSVGNGIEFDEQGRTTRMLGLQIDVTERKIAEQDLKRYNQRLAILRNIDREIVRAKSPYLIITETLDLIRTLIPCWRASVTLFENDVDEGVVFSVSSEAPKVAGAGTRISMVNNPQIEQLKAGESLIIADVQSIDEPISPAGKKLIKAGVRSAVTTPLMADERLIGLMSLTDKQPHFFSIEYQEVIEEVANQLAIALRQQQLREAIQQYNELLEERVRQRTAKLNALNRELETFTYSVSHDLKAPLRGIDGYSQLLLEGYADKLDEDGRSFLRKVRYAAEHMNQLIEDLLTYSRLERREMHVIELDIHALVNALVNEHTTDIQNQNSIVDIDIPFRLIRTDRDGLAMALRNLIENAFKFSRNEPTPQIKISGQETEKSCILWVQDNGIGFDMAHQERIFEIFQRLHRSEIFPGTGIGLALVRKAMDRLDGKAWAESNPGQGAKFYLELKK